MQSTRPLTPAARNRAMDRLQRLTTGVTVAGIVGTIGFSAAAAISNPGKQAVASTATTRSADQAEGDTQSGTSSFFSDDGRRSSLGSISIGSSASGSVQATTGETMGTATWTALGSGVRLVTHGGDTGRARRAVSGLLRLVDTTYSRFRRDSELSRLNAQAGQTVPVRALLALAVETALRAAHLTDGLVDPTVGRAMRLIGYDRDFAAIGRGGQGSHADLRFEPIPGWQAVHLDASAGTVRLSPGVELDLGSTGKALAADLAAATGLAASGGKGVLVSLGGDIALAGEAPPGGWRVLAAEDSATPPEADGEVITLGEGAVATSSTTVRRWTRSGIAMHHLVDPRTGAPVRSPWRTATVAAATCVDANTAATAAILLGDAAPSWLEARGLPARLTSRDGTVRRLPGWPAPFGARQPNEAARDGRRANPGHLRTPAAEVPA